MRRRRFVESRDMQQTITDLCSGRLWEPWHPLENSWQGTTLPSCPGLYRLRLVEPGTAARMAYIGQSGRSLKERVGSLKGVYGRQMPYRAPHTAGPALWAWRQAVSAGYLEVSVAALPTIPEPLRLGLECLAIA